MEHIKIAKIDNVILNRRNIQHKGTLHLTTHHLIFTFNNREIWVCYPILAQVIHLKDESILKLNGKDFQFLTLTFQNKQECLDVYDSISKLTVVNSIEKLYAFNYQPNHIESDLNSWNIYNPIEEFKRQGLNGDIWRVSNINSNYQLCPTYPSVLVIPKTISDTVITHASKFRSKQRLPSLTYYYKPYESTITRCSQPLTGLKQSRSIQDEKLIMEIFKNSNNGNSNNNLIVDCRPQTNAIAQTALGAGSEIMDNYNFAQKIFLNIDNIHVMRDSLNKLVELLQDFSKPLNPTLLENTKWLRYLSIIMSSLEKLIKFFIFNKANLLIHCSDGWDRTSQISSLLQICIDPYYRTFKGFMILVEKDWLSFGHRFNERSGHLSNTYNFHQIDDDLNSKKKGFKYVFSKLRTDLTSPIFHQFLDVIYQILRQFPDKFEFNERFLRRLIYHLYSCQYGTFLTNCEVENIEIRNQTRSVWDYFLSRPKEFINPDYQTGETKLNDDYIIPNFKDLKWWWQLYGRNDAEMNDELNDNDNEDQFLEMNVIGKDQELNISSKFAKMDVVS